MIKNPTFHARSKHMKLRYHITGDLMNKIEIHLRVHRHTWECNYPNNKDTKDKVDI